MQIASAEAVRAGDQAELAGLRTQVEELQAAVGQAVEEIEAQNEAQAQQQAAAQDLADQVALKDAELAALQSTIEDLQLRAAEGRAPQQVVHSLKQYQLLVKIMFNVWMVSSWLLPLRTQSWLLFRAP